MSTLSNRDVAALLFGKTRRAVLALLYGRPEEALHLRQILREVNSGHGAVQREMKQLAAAGIVSRRIEGNLVFYQANTDSPIFKELQKIIAPAARATPSEADEVLTPVFQRFAVSQRQVARFCRKHHIKKLSLFGSVLRGDFRPDSDIDVLVEFEAGHVPGFGIVEMENELSRIVGRKVDLRTPGDLSRYFRDRVVSEAEVRYAAK